MSIQMILVLALAGLLHGSLADMECCDLFKYAPGSGRCYLIVNNTKNWDDAKQLCQDIGTTLPKPKSQVVNEFLLRQTGQVDVWMSAQDLDGDGNWVWEDGSAIAETFWGPNEPNNQGVENCGTVKASSQMWNDDRCEKLWAFACETCMEGWKKRTGSPNKCYYIEKTDLKNRADAKQFCDNLNATLVKPMSQQENEWLLQQTGQEDLWISAQDLDLDGNWAWEDGSAIAETFWGPNEPNNQGVENCGTVKASTQMWNDDRCEKLWAFACEI